MRQCVILVGGKGTRLGAATAMTPKPLLNVAGRPFLDYLLDRVSFQGFTEVLLLAGHLGRDFAAFDGSKRRGVRISVLVEREAMGTAGALHEARARLDSEFLLINGDSILDGNWLSLLPFLRGDTAIAMVSANIAERKKNGFEMNPTILDIRGRHFYFYFLLNY